VGGLSVANLLLQISGDPDDAQRALADVSRDLALFGRETAEAEVDVNTASARANLEELEARLTAFSAEEASAEVNVLIAKAQSDIAVLQAELNRIDGEEVKVDVDVRRGIVEKIASLTGQIEKLDAATSQASSGGISSFISGIGEAFQGASIFGVSLRAIAIAAPFVIAALVAVAGQILAVVASAGSAVAGLAALGVAFLSVLPGGIALAIGAIANFKEEAETVGTAAYALKENVSELADVFTDATSGGADALFVGISDAIRELTPMIDGLGPAFTNLGKAGGDAFRLLGEQFSSPEWGKFFEFTIDSLAKLTPLFAESFGAFSDILKNISKAAMPFLVDGLGSLADGLGSIADKTSDIQGLREVIGGMVGSLKSWGELLGGLTDLVAAFVEAFAPFGDSIVESLGEGAHNLADWLRSEDGLKRINEFFTDTGPVARELARLILNVGKVLLQIGEFFAPLAAAVLAGLNEILEGFSDFLEWLKDIDRALAFSKWGDFFSDVGDAIKSAFIGAAEFVGGVVEQIAGLVATPIKFVIGFADDIAERARNIWNSVKSAITDAIKFVIGFAGDIASRARSIWSAVKSAITDAIKFVLGLPGDLAGRARNVWGDVKGVISDAISFVLGLPGDLSERARNVWNGVKGVVGDAINFVLNLPGVGGLVSAAKAIWEAINDALPDITIDIHIPHPDVPGFASGVRSMAEGRLSLVGEEGPELRYVPSGADIYTASETQRILRALAGGASAPVAAAGPAPALAGGGGGNVIHNDVKIVSPGTGSPDPRIARAQWDAELRAKGALG
jgi:phage-related protein